MNKIKMIGLLDIKGQENVRRVYDPTGISPCLTTSAGGNRQPKILVGDDEVQKAFAIRGRYNEQGKIEQKVELRKDDVTSTLTGVQKDNMLIDGGGKGLKTLKTNDLFCGAGGMGLGFKEAGFEIAGAWDFDKYAVQSYKHNVGDHVLQADITQMKAEDLPQADVWTFGFPCQDLSIAGKQAGLFEGKRSGLFFEVMRLLDETEDKPKIIMAENVKGLKPYLEVLEEEYKQLGYKMYYTLYNSKFWGVPQNRERYFVVGVHEGIEKEFEFPIQQDKYITRLSTVLESEVDEKYYIPAERSEKFIAEAILKSPDDLQSAWTDKSGASFAATATYYKGLDHTHIASSQRTGVISESPKEGLRVRKLTPTEYKRLQGFPESYEIVVSDSQAYKQFGNAVTVNVARAIAEQIKMFLLSI